MDTCFPRTSEFHRSSDCRKNLRCREVFGMRQQQLKYLLDHLASVPAKGRRLLESGEAVPARQACYMVARLATVVNVSIT